MAGNFSYFPSSSGGSGANASVGTNGIAAPGSSTLVAGKSGAGLLVPLNVDASGNLNVLVSSLPLPTGAATEATLSALNAKVPAQGQALAAGSVPVVLTAAQLSTLTPLSSVTVSGTVTANAGTNLNTSALNLETTQSAISAKLPATLGQKAMSASLAVTIASDQSAIPVTTSVSDVTASGTITTQNLVPAGTATANSAVASGALNGAGTASIQVTGTYTGALSLQYTVDGTNWITAGGTPFLNVNTGTWLATITSALQGIFQIETTGMPQYRITALAAVTGTATVSLRTSRASAIMAIDASLPAGAAIIGALVANQSVNNAQINGVAMLAGNGVTGTGSQRVTVASDNTPFPIKIDQTTKGTTNAVEVVPNATATGGLSRAASTVLATNLVIKATAGRLYQLTGYNSKATAQFILIFNATSLPADGTAPIDILVAQPQQNFSFDLPANYGDFFSTGIVACNSSTAATKTIGSADCWFVARYL